ncbi:MAG: hypothetical protein RPR40_12415 [Bermanella sp.]
MAATFLGAGFLAATFLATVFFAAGFFAAFAIAFLGAAMVSPRGNMCGGQLYKAKNLYLYKLLVF